MVTTVARPDPFEYLGLKRIAAVKKAYLKERFWNWLNSRKNHKEDAQLLTPKKPLRVAHVEFKNDGEDTECDADSDFEMELKVYENLDSLKSKKQEKQLFVPKEGEVPANKDDGKLLTFEGAGVEPNMLQIFPEHVWAGFLPNPRPNPCKPQFYGNTK